MIERFDAGEPMSRRRFLGLAAQAGILLPLAGMGTDLLSSAAPVRSPGTLGATVSFRQARWLGLDPRELFEAVLRAGFAPIRVVADWSEVESSRGRFDLADTMWQLDRARAANIKTILSFGAKTPRYPEFNVPGWVLAGLDERPSSERERFLLEQTLAFNAVVLAAAGNDASIAYVQPGNEDLEPSEVTQWRSLSESFVRGVVADTRTRTRLPVLLTSSMPLTLADFFFRAFRGHIDDALTYVEIADAVAFNTHVRIRNSLLGLTSNFNPGPHYWPMLAWLRDRTWSAGKQAMIGELQAEPFDYTVEDAEAWGRDPNITTADIGRLDRRVRRMEFGTRLAWGVEFAYWRLQQGDSSFWDYLASGAGPGGELL